MSLCVHKIVPEQTFKDMNLAVTLNLNTATQSFHRTLCTTMNLDEACILLLLSTLNQAL